MMSYDRLQELDMSDSERMMKNIENVINSMCNKLCDQLKADDLYPIEMIEALAHLINARTSLAINKNQ